MCHHQISNYLDHLRRLQVACEWIGIVRGRAAQYESLIKQFFEDGMRSKEHFLAYNESCEITEIYELWKMRVNDFRGLFRKIKSVFGKGPVLREDEKSANSSNRPRNDAFVYLLAGKLLKAGINVIAIDGSSVDGDKCKSNADITFCHNRSVIDIQCKRPLSLSRTQERVRDACGQIMKSTTGRQAGIVGLDCSAIIRPAGTLVEKDSAKDAMNFLGYLMERDIVPEARESLKPDVLGLIMFARSPAMIRNGQSLILSNSGIPYTRFRLESISSSLVVTNPICSDSGRLKELFEMLHQSLQQ